MRSSLTFFSVLLLLTVSAQIPAKRYKWKQVGPISTPKTNGEVGRSTAVGIGWVEDLLITADGWYAGSITGGLFKTTNKGEKWKKVDKDTLQYGTLCLLQVGDTIFRGTGLTHYDDKFGVGLMYSIDRGKNWEHTGLQFKPKDYKPLWDVDAASNGTMLACTPTEIHLSHDGSKTWQNVYKDATCNFREVLIDNKGHMWVCGNRLLYSKDGQNWQDKTPLLSTNKTIGRISIAQDAQNSNKFIVFYGEGNRGVLDQSYDGGTSWSRLYESRKVSRADVHHTEIKIAPNDSNVIVLGTYRAYISKDAGKSFNIATTPKKYAPNFAHDDIRGIVLDASDNIYLATDGGVFHSTDTGTTWINKSGKGLAITQIFGLGQLSDNSVVIGCQDLGYFHYKDKKWMHLGHYYGDGGDALETSKGLNVLLGGRMKRIDLDRKGSYISVHPPTRANPFIAKMIPYPNARDTFYYIGKDVWLIANETKVNLSKSIDSKDEIVSGFDVNKKNPKQLLFSYNQPTWNANKLSGKLFKSIDGGKTWTDITKTLPILAWRHITGIVTDPINPRNIVVSLGKIDSREVHKAYKSTDGGQTWSNFSEGLPPYETFGIWHITESTGLLLSSMEGLFYRNANMEKWQKLDGKIPSIPIRDVVIDKKNRKIKAATYGSGLWYLKMPKKMLKY